MCGIEPNDHSSGGFAAAGIGNTALLSDETRFEKGDFTANPSRTSFLFCLFAGKETGNDQIEGSYDCIADKRPLIHYHLSDFLYLYKR